MATTGFQCSVSVEPIMFHCMLSGGRSGATKEIRSKHTEDMLVAFFLKASFWRNIQILGFCWISNKVNKLHCRQHLVIIWENCWCPKTNASGRPDCTYLRGSESFSWSQVSPNKGENVVGNSYWQALPHPDCSSRFILSFSFFFFFSDTLGIPHMRHKDRVTNLTEISLGLSLMPLFLIFLGARQLS